MLRCKTCSSEINGDADRCSECGDRDPFSIKAFKDALNGFRAFKGIAIFVIVVSAVYFSGYSSSTIGVIFIIAALVAANIITSKGIGRKGRIRFVLDLAGKQYDIQGEGYEEWKSKVRTLKYYDEVDAELENRIIFHGKCDRKKNK